MTKLAFASLQLLTVPAYRETKVFQAHGSKNFVWNIVNPLNTRLSKVLARCKRCKDAIWAGIVVGNKVPFHAIDARSTLQRKQTNNF